MLKRFNPELETILETDASDYVVSGVLSQCYPSPSLDLATGIQKMILHPIPFLSEKMSPAECNYGIGDEELLVIVACLEKWHMYLHGVQFTIITDHHNLQNFGTKALLNHRQAPWVGLLPQCKGAPISVQLNYVQEHRYSNIDLDSAHNPMTVH